MAKNTYTQGVDDEMYCHIHNVVPFIYAILMYQLYIIFALLIFSQLHALFY